MAIKCPKCQQENPSNSKYCNECGTQLKPAHAETRTLRTPARGSTIGEVIADKYKLLEELGRGGMGVVYKAEQIKPVKRSVAFKIIKLGMDTKHVVARFETERQALAVMDHPSIAKVFDGGATDAGRPYFVMELVRGIPITDYCDKSKLTTKERLELFLQVCQAVQHAHQKGVIHRDLKPSNILVMVQEDEPIPKIIDFGIAKATEHSLTERTLFTEQGQLIGTPEYMSPEQAEMSGLDVDTRTDIYSLGVILYELLVGVLPFDSRSLREAGLGEIQRIIREMEPPKASTRLSSLGDTQTSIAEQRKTDITSLHRELKGDLDWITMKAMEKDRMRRYATASEFAADIEKHLKHEPVLASPPSTVYRIRKFVKRHRVGVVAAAALLLFLVGFSVVVSIQSNRIAKARREADIRRAQAEDMIEFMLGDLREKLESIGRLDVLEEVGDKAQEYFSVLPEEDLSGDELLRRSQMMHQIGQVRWAQGSIYDAEAAFQKSIKYSQELVERDSDNDRWQLGLAHSHYWLGYLKWRQNEIDEAMKHYQVYYEIAKMLFEKNPENPEWQMEYGYGNFNIGQVHELKGDLSQAIESFRNSTSILKKLAEQKPQDPQIAYGLGTSYSALGRMLHEHGDLEEALKYFKDNVTILERLVDQDPKNSIWRNELGVAYNHYGYLYESFGSYELAAEIYRKDLKIAEDLFLYDPENNEKKYIYALSLMFLGSSLVKSNEIEKGLKDLITSMDLLQELLALNPENREWICSLASCQYRVANAFLGTGKTERSLGLVQNSLSLLNQIIETAPDHQDARRFFIEASIILGHIQEVQGRREDAKGTWNRALEMIEEKRSGLREVSLLDRVKWVICMLYLDRIEGAMPEIEQLWESGYREKEFVVLMKKKDVMLQ